MAATRENEKDREKGEGGPEAQAAPAEKKAEMFRNGRMTRAGMEHTIKNGSSVLHNGRVISKLEDIPDEAELVAGDAEAAEMALQSLDEEEARLAARRARLERSRTAPGTPPPQSNPPKK